MRKFLTKYGFGLYWWKLPDKEFLQLKKDASTGLLKKMFYGFLLLIRFHQYHYNTTSRFGFWCFNLWLVLALPGIVAIFILEDPDPFLKYLIIFVPIGALTLYFGFPLRFGGKKGIGYSERFPIRWEELDDQQKWFYGAGINSGQLQGQKPFPAKYMSEWMRLNQLYRKKFRLNK